MPDRIRISPHEAVPRCGSFEVRFPDGRPSRFCYWDDIAGRRLRPDQFTSKQALQDAKLKEVLARDGTEALPSASPEAFAAFLREEAEVTARVIRETGAKFD